MFSNAFLVQNLLLTPQRVPASSIQPTSPSPPGTPTGGESRLLLSLGEVGVGVEVRLQGGRRVDGFTPAFPLDQVSHSALGHGGRLGHMVLHDLGDA